MLVKNTVFYTFLYYIQTTAFCIDIQLQSKLFNSSLIFKEVFQNKFNFWAAKKLIITLQLNITLSSDFLLISSWKILLILRTAMLVPIHLMTTSHCLYIYLTLTVHQLFKVYYKTFIYVAVQTERAKDCEISTESL